MNERFASNEEDTFLRHNHLPHPVCVCVTIVIVVMCLSVLSAIPSF